MPLPLQVTPRYSAIDHRGGLAADLIGWDDLQGSIQAGANVGALTTEAYRDTSFRMSFFRSGQVDNLSFVYQFPHSWQPGTLIRPHLHVVPMVNPAVVQNVLIEGQWAWGSELLALGANATWTTFSALVPIGTTDAFKVKVIDLTAGLGIQPPAGIVESDLFLIYVQRTGNNVADTYNTGKTGGTALANLGLLSVDVHIQAQKNGSPVEFGG